MGIRVRQASFKLPEKAQTPGKHFDLFAPRLQEGRAGKAWPPAGLAHAARRPVRIPQTFSEGSLTQSGILK